MKFLNIYYNFISGPVDPNAILLLSLKEVYFFIGWLNTLYILLTFVGPIPFNFSNSFTFALAILFQFLYFLANTATSVLFTDRIDFKLLISPISPRNTISWIGYGYIYIFYYIFIRSSKIIYIWVIIYLSIILIKK